MNNLNQNTDRLKKHDGPKTTLGAVVAKSSSNVRSYNVLMGENLGHLTLKMAMSIREFINVSEVGNDQTIETIAQFEGEFKSQRPLILDHAKGLGLYTLMGLVQSQIKEMERDKITVPEKVRQLRDHLGNPPYACLLPVVVNIRETKPGGNDIEASQIEGSLYQVYLGDKQILWVIDGQHRRKGFELVLEYLDSIIKEVRYPKKGLFFPPNQDGEIIDNEVYDFWKDIKILAMTRSTVAIEVHLGLGEKEEQQLFYDLNSKGRKVQTSFAFKYDHTDAVIKFVKEALVDGKVLPFEPLPVDKNEWHKDEGALLMKDVVQISCFIIAGKGTSKGVTPAKVKERQDFAVKFWERIVKIPGFGEKGSKTKTVVAQPVVLKALAKLANDLAFGAPSIKDTKAFKALYPAIFSGKLDFSHENPLWKALFLTSKEREEKYPGIEKYIHVPIGTNLDAGTVDEDHGWVRFGSRHNDIYPRLGDLIRFKLEFDPRPSVSKSIAKELDPEGYGSVARKARRGIDYEAIVKGEKITEHSLKGILSEVISHLGSKNPNFLQNLSKTKRGSRMLVAKTKEEIYPGAPHLSHYTTILSGVTGEWYIGTNYSKHDVQKILEIAAEVAGLEFGKDLVLNF